MRTLTDQEAFVLRIGAPDVPRIDGFGTPEEFRLFESLITRGYLTKVVLWETPTEIMYEYFTTPKGKLALQCYDLVTALD